MYNHDLHVSDEFAEQFPTIKHLLRQEELLRRFDLHDKTAKKNKALFLRLGIAALLFGFSALVGIILEIFVPAVGGQLPKWVVVVIETTAIVAIAIVLFDRFITCSKSHYLLACFARERLRHWQFQMFLDGNLVSMGDHAAQASIINTRLKNFDQSHQHLQGSSADYMHRPASPENLLHPYTPYSDVTVANEVFAALKTIRFEHQSQFAKGKGRDAAAPHHIGLSEHYHWSETFARLSLVGAVSIAVIQLVLMCLQTKEMETEFHNAHSALTACALLLVAVSATARAYRTGLTLPEELESYEDYASHVEMLRTRLESADNARKQELLKELELEAERELQRFIRMKSKATFLA